MYSDLINQAKEVFDIEAFAVLGLKDRIDEDFVKAVEVILASKGRLVLIGMGKSGNIAKKISATLASTGTPTLFIHPADAIHGDLGMLTKDDVVCAISYSGETEEIIRLIPYVKGQNPIIGITGNNESTLAKNSDFVLDVYVEKEACPLQLAPTSSTTATLAMGDALAVVLMKKRGFARENFAKFHPGGSLGKKLLTNVEDVMRKNDLPIVKVDDNLKNIIDVMTTGRLGLAIVVDDKEIKGIITDGDLRRTFNKYSIEQMVKIRATDIMTSNPKQIMYNEKLTKAEEIMNQNKITSLLVVNQQSNLLGVIQIYDINL